MVIMVNDKADLQISCLIIISKTRLPSEKIRNFKTRFSSV